MSWHMQKRSSAGELQKSVLNSLVLELQEILRCPIWTMESDSCPLQEQHVLYPLSHFSKHLSLLMDVSGFKLELIQSTKESSY